MPFFAMSTNASHRCYSRDLFASFAVLSAVLILLTGCGGEKESTAKTNGDADGVALVGDKVITVSEFEDELKRRQSLGRVVADRSKILDEMIARESMLQRVKRDGIDADSDVRREVENLLIAKLWEREFEPASKSMSIDDNELRAEYESRLAGEFTRPAKIRLAILKLGADPHMSEDRKAELREKLSEARKLTLSEPTSGGRGPAALGFGKYSITYSDDQVSRYRGGDIGWFIEGNLEHHVPSEVLTAGYSLDTREISEIIETVSGYYLVTKTDSRPAEVVAFEKAAPMLTQSLLVKRKQALREQFLAEARELAGVTIYTELLDQVQLPEPEVKVVARETGFAAPGVPGIRVEEK